MGGRVSALFRADGKWYPGVVRSVTAGGIAVDFDDGDEEEGLRPEEVRHLRGIFAGTSFIVTGVREEERDPLEAAIRKHEGLLRSVQELEGVPAAHEVSGASLGLLRHLAEGAVVLVSGAPLKTTMKLFFGLALGLQPLRPSWVFDSVRQNARLAPTSRHVAALPNAAPRPTLRLRALARRHPAVGRPASRPDACARSRCPARLC